MSDLPQQQPNDLPGARPRGERQLTSEAIHRHDLLRWRALSVVMASAGVVGLVVIALLPGTSSHDQTVMLIAGAGVLALAVAARFTPATPPASWILASELITTLVVSGIVAFAEDTAAFPFFYILPVVSAAYLLPRSHAVAVGVTASAGLALALALRPAGFDLLLWGQASLVGAGVTVAVWGMRRGRDRLVGELERLGSTDGLTGLANRGTFDQVAERLVLRAQIDETPLALVVFDIDHFKQLNSTHGHAAGDEALRSFAATLQTQSRPTDLIARIGGEEFVAVMPGIGPDEAGAFAERVGEALRGQYSVGTARLTVSAGVAPMSQKDTVDALLREAYQALYAAKGAGRDRVVLAELVAFPGT
ncbi:MAG: GGDEF domain-containing protein [Solirubrobacteraceae bacterium]|nr:GGDEF domain-containing protein [Solirubrobacteraceae bacterium]